MIAFATLFLGLVAGVQEVDLLVSDEVQAVEILLDQRRVARLTAAPWRFQLDLGERLEPHRLEAIAFAADGGELGRASQWVNLPRPAAEASLALELDANGAASRVRLGWQSLAAAEPSSVSIVFDGRPLAVPDPRSFDLPAYEPQQLHLLRAELTFDENLSAVAEATFGGFYAEAVSTRLTALPVTIEGRVPDVGSLQGTVSQDGEAVTVVAIEKLGADVVVVRDQAAKEGLGRLGRSGAMSGSLGRGARLRILWATPRWRQHEDQTYMLFPRSADHAVRGEELYWQVARAPWPSGSGEPQRLADAVAVAGLVAAERNRPRAVIAVLGPPPEGGDASQLEPERVGEYLDALGVPLFVWCTDVESWDREQLRARWGEVQEVTTAAQFNRAVRVVRQALADQHIVWVEGDHLPQSLTLSASVRGVSLLSR